MPGPNLAGARAKVESFMDDTCRVERDPAGRYDDLLDETTGQLAPPDADSAVLWQGRCILLPASDARQPELPGPAALTAGVLAGRYRAMIPLAAPVLPEGSTLTVTASKRDPQLPGRRFRVLAPGPQSTFAVIRSVELEAL